MRARGGEAPAGMQVSKPVVLCYLQAAAPRTLPIVAGIVVRNAGGLCLGTAGGGGGRSGRWHTQLL